MKFLDSNVLIYAFFKTERKLEDHERELKEKSRKIIDKIDEGEKVTTSTVHLSEVANVLSACFSARNLADLFETFYSMGNFLILDVSAEDYILSVEMSREVEVKVNDCLAAHLMSKDGLKEIYTFDHHFEEFELVTLQGQS